MNFDHFVYLRVFEGCQLRCKHCFIPSNPSKMSLEQITNLDHDIEKFAKEGDRVLLQWHGGEPFAWGVNNFKKAFSMLDGIHAKYQISHSIQTNLLSYNEQWKEVIQTLFKGKLGVSWDHAIRVYANKPDSYQQYNDVFFEKLKIAQDDGLDLDYVVTITKPLINDFTPQAFLNFLVEKNMMTVSFQKLTKTGYAAENWDEIGVNHLEHETYLKKMLRPYIMMKRQGINLTIHTLDEYLGAVASKLQDKPRAFGCNSGVCDSKFHTVSASGYSVGCTALTTEENALFNTVQNDVVVIDPVSLSNYRQERTFSCKDCDFNTVCSSGCMTEKLFDGSGGCNGGMTVFAECEKLFKRKILTY